MFGAVLWACIFCPLAVDTAVSTASTASIPLSNTTLASQTIHTTPTTTNTSDYDYYDYSDDDDYSDDYDPDYFAEDATGACPPAFLGRCTCSTVEYQHQQRAVVNCTNTGFTDATILRHTPDNVQVLIFSGNYVPTLPTDMFGSTAPRFGRLETLDLSNNGIRHLLAGCLRRASRVHTLILNHNELGGDETSTKATASSLADSRRVFGRLSRLQSLHLSNAFSERVAADRHMVALASLLRASRLRRLSKLHLEQNEITSLPDITVFCRLPALQQLYLGTNRLSSLDVRPLTCVPRLQYVDVQYNSLSRLDASSLRQLDRLAAAHDRFSLKLTGNPFRCDCALLPLLRWMQTTRVTLPERRQYRCFSTYGQSSPAGPQTPSILDDFSPSRLSCAHATHSTTTKTSSTSTTTFVTDGVSPAAVALLAFLVALLVALLVATVWQRRCGGGGGERRRVYVAPLKRCVHQSLARARRWRQYVNIDSVDHQNHHYSQQQQQQQHPPATHV